MIMMPSWRRNNYRVSQASIPHGHLVSIASAEKAMSYAAPGLGFKSRMSWRE